MNTNNRSSGYADLLLEDDFIDWDESAVLSDDDDLAPDHEYADQGEFIETLIPLLAAALPVVLPALASTLPSVIQAGSNIFQGIVKGTQGGGSKNPPSTQQRTPVAKPAASAAATSTTGTDNPALSVLLQIINNPAVIQALTGALSGSNQGVQATNGTVVTPAQITQTISQVASSATPAAKGTISEGFPEFILDDNDVPLIDPFDAVQKAELLNELLQ